jgi:hypothetical protein
MDGEKKNHTCEKCLNGELSLLSSKSLKYGASQPTEQKMK